MGGNIDEILDHDNAMHYMYCIKSALDTGKEVCAYTIQDHIFVARMIRISSKRVKVIERDVTGLSPADAFKLF